MLLMRFNVDVPVKVFAVASILVVVRAHFVEFYVAVGVGVLFVTNVVHPIIDNDDILVLAYIVTDFQFGHWF